MSKELRELHHAISGYALEHSVKQIPHTYYDKMVETWSDMNLNGHDWDHTKAAAALLYAVVIDGIVHQSQMTPRGYRAMNWAESYLQKLDAMAS